MAILGAQMGLGNFGGMPNTMQATAPAVLQQSGFNGGFPQARPQAKAIIPLVDHSDDSQNKHPKVAPGMAAAFRSLHIPKDQPQNLPGLTHSNSAGSLTAASQAFSATFPRMAAAPGPALELGNSSFGADFGQQLVAANQMATAAAIASMQPLPLNFSTNQDFLLASAMANGYQGNANALLPSTIAIPNRPPETLPSSSASTGGGAIRHSPITQPLRTKAKPKIKRSPSQRSARSGTHSRHLSGTSASEDEKDTPMTTTDSAVTFDEMDVSQTISLRVLNKHAEATFGVSAAELTPEQHREVVKKILTKRERNTNAARKSRSRQREVQDYLETRLTETERENSALKTKVAILTEMLTSLGVNPSTLPP